MSTKRRGHLRPHHNDQVYMWHKGRNNTEESEGPLLLMHDQSIKHLSSLTQRWQDNRKEKRIWEGRICQDCGNSQIPSYNTKDGGRSAKTSHFTGTYILEEL